MKCLCIIDLEMFFLLYGYIFILCNFFLDEFEKLLCIKKYIYNKC